MASSTEISPRTLSSSLPIATSNSPTTVSLSPSLHSLLLPQSHPLLLTCLSLLFVGLYYLTECGQNCNFPIGSPSYLPPEVIAEGPCSVSSPQSDVWSVGIVLLELVTLTRMFRGETKDPSLIFLDVSSFCGHKLEYSSWKKGENVVGCLQPPPYSFYSNDDDAEREQIAKRHELRLREVLTLPGMERVSLELKGLIRECLTLLPSSRKTPSEMMHHSYFHSERLAANDRIVWAPTNLGGTGPSYPLILLSSHPLSLSLSHSLILLFSLILMCLLELGRSSGVGVFRFGVKRHIPSPLPIRSRSLSGRESCKQIVCERIVIQVWRCNSLRGINYSPKVTDFSFQIARSSNRPLLCVHVIYSSIFIISHLLSSSSSLTHGVQ
jgi:serine/threonine protein kinase